SAGAAPTSNAYSNPAVKPTKMAMPPKSAVGCRCQRSALGFATHPSRRTTERTTGVATSEAPAAITPTSTVDMNIVRSVLSDRGDQLRTMMRGHVMQDLVEAHPRTPPDLPEDLLYAGHPPWHIFEVLFVRDLEGHELDRRTRPHHLDHPPRQLQDGDLLRSTHVVDLS